MQYSNGILPEKIKKKFPAKSISYFFYRLRKIRKIFFEKTVHAPLHKPELSPHSKTRQVSKNPNSPT